MGLFPTTAIRKEHRLGIGIAVVPRAGFGATMRHNVSETDPSLMNTVPHSEAGAISAPTSAPAPTAKFDPLVGTTLAERYEVVRRIGEGGMGAVYEAKHSIIGKRVAIKVLLEKFLENEEFIARLLQEARLASSIGHQNIVDVTDFGTTRDGRAFVVMEYLEGEPLSELVMRDAPLPVERSLAIVKQVASALSAAHKKGIVHRDVKPENVYLVRRDDQDFVKVVDFGVSKAVRTQEEGTEWQRLTRTGAVLGTPLFMSPEQAAGVEDIDARVDIWSAALILYECLTGELPFRGTNYLGVISQIQTKEVQPPSVMRPELGIPQSVDRVVMHGLEKDRDKRYLEMADFERDVERVLAGDVDLGLAADSSQAPSVPVAPSRGWIWNAGVIGVFALGIGGAAVLARGSKQPPASPVPAPPAATIARPPAISAPPSPPPVRVPAVEPPAAPADHPRKPIKGHPAARPTIVAQPQPTPPPKKSKADDKIAPSPYTEPKAP